MEFIATVAFCLTVPIGLAVLFLLFRTNGMKREFTRRLQQLEEQVQALQAGDRPTPALTSVAASATPPAAVTPAAVTPAMPELFPAPAMVAAEAHPPAAAVIAAEGREPAPASAMPVQTPARPRTPLSLPPPVRWFLERHLMVQLGVVILFIGVAFLLKYAADQGWLSLELRHVGAAAGGVLLALIGWRLRKQARVYGLALQGAGLGVIYLTTFFAYGIYGLIPGGLAFVLFVLLGVVCATAAVVNNAQILAFLAVVGAFLAPILASSGEGSHVALFSYYALVNAAILAIAWFRAWRLLNLAGFGFTLWAGLVWGSNAYEPALFASTEPFLVLFFLFYLAIAILYAIRQPREGETRQGPDPVDVTLVFGNPLAAFALQTFVVAHLPYGTAVSALTLALLYGVLALSMVRGILPVRQLLAECFLFLSFFFLALSVPLFFDARMTAATWAIGGAAWVWLGVRRQRFWTIGWGLVVQLGAAGAYGLVRVQLLGDQLPLLSLFYLGALLIGAAGLFSAYQLWRWAQAAENAWLKLLSYGLSLWGLLWWFGGGAEAIVETIGAPYRVTGVVFFFALSGIGGELIGQWLWSRGAWFAPRLPLILLWPLLLALAVLQLVEAPHHFAGIGWLAWPVALAAHYWMLQRHTGEQRLPAVWWPLSHAAGLWLFAFVVTWFTGWGVQQRTESTTWVTVAVLLVTSLLILVASDWIVRLPPLLANAAVAYRTLGATPLVLFGLLWSFVLRVDDSGGGTGLPYVPLFNPLDLATLVFFAVLWRWVRCLALAHPSWLIWPWAVASFLALNLAIARAVHHLTGVAYTPAALYDTALLQTTYSIVWGALALVLMFWATRRRWRQVWIGGALILALTVGKLFLVDLSNADTIARIVSFIGVGLLVIVIAYFAPVPPLVATEHEPTQSEAVG